MNKNSNLLIVFICGLIFFIVGESYAACINKWPVFGTGDDRQSCEIKLRLKKEENALNIKKKQQKLARERQGLTNNSGTGAGSGNTNVILTGLREMMGNNSDQIQPAEAIILTQHQVRIELMPYVFPGAYQFDEPGMPEKLFFNGAAWEYYVNKNLGFGFLWQEWSKKDGRGFDPVMNNHPDASGDYYQTPTIFPGSVDRIKYTMYIPYVTINAQLGSPLWNGIFRVGLGRTQADIEYDEIDRLSYPYAEQPLDIQRVDNASIMLDIAVERWTYGAKIGGALRYINARHETTDYLDYINLSSAQIIFYVQFMLQPLGLL